MVFKIFFYLFYACFKIIKHNYRGELKKKKKWHYNNNKLEIKSIKDNLTEQKEERERIQTMYLYIFTCIINKKKK